MRCCVPFCKNTTENAAAQGISFHRFPSYRPLRAAWLSALGKQNTPVADSAVVCSQHFLNDDLFEAEDGSRQVCTGAIPTTVQVCFVCLDADSKMFLMSKHNLDEAYEQLIGYPVYDGGNLKQTACIHCAQRLRDFSSFRDKSLRVRELMMDLVKKHEIVTKRHIKMMNKTKKLKGDIVKVTQELDHCDEYFQHPDAHKQAELEDFVVEEESIYFMADDDYRNENYNSDDNYDHLETKYTIANNDHNIEDIEVKHEDDIKRNMEESKNININNAEERHDNDVDDAIHLEATQIDKDIDDVIQLESNQIDKDIDDAIHLESNQIDKDIDDAIHLESNQIDKDIDDVIQLESNQIDKDIDDAIHLESNQIDEDINDVIQLESNQMDEEIDDVIQLEPMQIDKEPSKDLTTHGDGKDVHRATGKKRNTVRLWVRRYRESGHVDHSRPGPKPSAYTMESDLHREIVATHNADPLLEVRTTAAKQNVTPQTVRNHLRAAGLPAKKILKARRLPRRRRAPQRAPETRSAARRARASTSGASGKQQASVATSEPLCPTNQQSPPNSAAKDCQL